MENRIITVKDLKDMYLNDQTKREFNILEYSEVKDEPSKRKLVICFGKDGENFTLIVDEKILNTIGDKEKKVQKGYIGFVSFDNRIVLSQGQSKKIIPTRGSTIFSDGQTIWKE